eukprot:CAMPEP_0174835688 /NCGR_PEP_ID=MMETSP1114-20130205/5536_1 /TAXON_ID=312471 /ORGANISM="Neobodo designis, Strain CCAP 1951/1" /LENGTH=199 /DNA_ID=CAMNT_0016069641 /DNA_START=50 /DNA_END=649 /DNA_ORIENTATION=-
MGCAQSHESDTARVKARANGTHVIVDEFTNPLAAEAARRSLLRRSQSRDAGTKPDGPQDGADLEASRREKAQWARDTVRRQRDERRQRRAAADRSLRSNTVTTTAVGGAACPFSWVVATPMASDAATLSLHGMTEGGTITSGVTICASTRTSTVDTLGHTARLTSIEEDDSMMPAPHEDVEVDNAANTEDDVCPRHASA